MKMPNMRLSTQDIGVYSRNTLNGTHYADEFLFDLKGRKAITKYREMRDNSSIIGAVLYAVEQTLKDVDFKIVSADENSDEANKEVDFVKSVLFEDMEHTLDDHVAEALSYLTFGFSWFEIVWKRREGQKSKYNDGRIGIKKIASRAQWSINKFDVDQKTGEILGMWQDTNNGQAYIQATKSLYYRTTILNNDPAGRSILRNSYQDWTYLNKLQAYEAIAIERELHGIPVGRMPSEYLSAEASDDNKAMREDFERILRDLKLNEQGYALLPSDKYLDTEGNPTDYNLMDITLMSASGSRSIDVGAVIQRYQHNVARSMMAEFMMLGSGNTGSYALSKSKTDLFLRSMESYINNIGDVLQKQLIERLWLLNGLPFETMPKIIAGDVAPHDLSELSSFLRNLNSAEINVKDQPKTVAELMNIAELPFDQDKYTEDLEEAKAREQEQRDLEAEQARSAISGNTNGVDPNEDEP